MHFRLAMKASLALAVLAASLTLPTQPFPAPESLTPRALAAPVEVGPQGAVEASAAAAAGDVRLIGSEGWSETSRKMVEGALAVLPLGLQAALGNPALGPLYISVNPNGRTTSGDQPYGGPANFFTTNEGRNEVVLYPNQSARTALHELGHAYNLRHVPAGAYPRVMLEPEMQAFMAIAKWRVLTSAETLARILDKDQVAYAYDGARIWTNLSAEDPMEDYANSFALYFYAPEQLYSLSPARYGYFATQFAALQ